MAEILSLQPKARAAEVDQQSLISALEEALAIAKTGEISSAIIILNRIDGLWHETITGSPMITRDIGRLEIVKQKWISSYLREEI